MGDFESAKKYFAKAIEAGAQNRGGILLGLGLLSDRTGNSNEGLKQCKEALAWYEERFSKTGNESSLEAKCCMSIAKLCLKLRDNKQALEFADRAVQNFKRTCGDDSPLVASALKTKGEILASMTTESENAVLALHAALRIEATKDALDMMTMMEIIQLVSNISQQMPAEKRAQTLKNVLEAAIKACANVRAKLPQDGNTAAFYKFVAELAFYAQELAVARELLTEAIPLFATEKSMDCSGLVKQCEELINLINNRI
jgi:tetratricopeptide (TPR) repeat protein